MASALPPSKQAHKGNEAMMSAAVKGQKYYDKMRKSVFSTKADPTDIFEDEKVAELADVIRTYRGCAEEDDHGKDLPWYDGEIFDVVMCSIIFLNIIVIAFETDLGGNKEGYARKAVWIVLEWVFCLIFMGEVYIKVKYKSWSWFREDPWSWLTAIVALNAFVNVTILGALEVSGLRILALVRVVTFLRLKKLVDHHAILKELKLVVRGMLGSWVSLLWAGVVLALVSYVFSIWTTTMIGLNEDFDTLYVESNGWDNQRLFGSILGSMFTLVQVMTLDRWCSGIVRYVESRNWYMSFVFFFFVLVCTYGMLNVIVSIIVEQVLTASSSNDKRKREREEKAKTAEMNNIREIFLLADTIACGSLSGEDFRNAAKEDPEVQWRLRMLELPVEEAQRLFQVIDGDGQRNLHMKEFVEGCTKLKGFARSKDLLALQHQADTCSKKMDLMARELLDSELMLKRLDTITQRMQSRFGPTVMHSRRMIQERVRGAAPNRPLPPEKPGDIDAGHLQCSNMPRLPNLPNLVD
jgi:voltage-gated sodium channel